jgi:hypothetical protein
LRTVPALKCCLGGAGSHEGEKVDEQAVKNLVRAATDSGPNRRNLHDPSVFLS